MIDKNKVNELAINLILENCYVCYKDNASENECKEVLRYIAGVVDLTSEIACAIDKASEEAVNNDA